MFNWLKKTASVAKGAAEIKVTATQKDEPATQLATSESEAFKDQGNAHLNNGRLEEAAACFRQAIARNPNYAEAYTNLGLVYKIQGNLGEAVALFRKAVALKPELLQAHLNLGVSLQSLGQADAAEESLRRVIALVPEQSAPLQHSAALQSLGVIAAQRGDFPQAELLLRHAIELQPDYAEAHNNLGNLFHLTHRPSEAEASYRRALELQPDYANAHFNLGILHVEAKRLPEAEASFRRALKLQPDYVDAHFNLGNLFLEAKRLPEAEACYRRALELQPDHASTLFNLGILLAETNRPAEAEVSYRRVLELQPDNASAHFNLGNLLLVGKRLPEAEASYSRALELKPDYADAYNNLGSLFQQTDRLPEAEASYRRAMELQPDYADAHNNLGNLHQNNERLPEAEAFYRSAIRIKPDYASAHFNLGNLLLKADRLSEAEASYLHAVELQPDYADAHNNLGSILHQSKRYPEAEEAYRCALEVKPDYAEAYNNLGNLFMQTYRLPEAEDYYRRALELKPDYIDALNNMGNLLLHNKHFPEAEAFYLRALELKPDYIDAYYNLGNLFLAAKHLHKAEASYRRALELKPDHAFALSNLGNALHSLGQVDEAVKSYRHALKIKPDYFEAHSNLIFSLDLAANADMSELQEERKKWDETYAAPLWQKSPHTNAPTPHRRLRVGYVSGDLKMHSAARVFGGMLTGYDRSTFDVIAYSNCQTKDDVFTELFKQNVTAWRDIVGMPDEAVATMIREDNIDILVDLSGHSAGNRLLVFAHKPAPIQITAWGYATGTGMRAMDVFFTDPVMVPPQEKSYFSEEIRYLPSVVGSFHIEQLPEVNELPALSDGVVTFGSFNRLAKLSEEAYQAWAEVLLAIPRSRLILKTAEFNDAVVKERVAGHFIKAGVAIERIIMLGGSSWYDHMRAYNQIDLALDPFPHGGGVTAMEGLMMGIPIIALRWPTVVGRLSASILTTLGLSGWIAESPEEYVRLAIQKASDLQSLAALRKQLRSIFTSSVIGDQAAYTGAVEKEYRQLWQEWCARHAPQKE